MHSPSPSSRKALLPLLCFLLSFISLGIFFSLRQESLGFYAFSPVMATLPALAVALILYRYSLKKQIPIFFQGVKSTSLLQMCLIFLLAGIFSSLAKSSGSVEAIVNLGLNLIPSQWLVVGTFLISAFIATAMGTSVGTIAAVSPVALGLAETTAISPLLIASTVISGAMFGDNLSMISDTTIASTQTQGCNMRDKFFENINMAIPAAIISMGLFFWLSPDASDIIKKPVSAIHTIPYLLIFIFAILGMRAIWILSIGIVVVSFVAFLTQDTYDLSQWGANLLEGAKSMKDLILLSLIIGGLGQLSEINGGFLYIKEKMDRLFSRLIKKHPKSQTLRGECAIASLVSITNLATANNTIAILLSGSTAKMISQTYTITAKRTASLLDIFSCVVQGVIPWGAQILLLSAAFGLNPMQIPFVSVYPLILLMVTLLIIFLKP